MRTAVGPEAQERVRPAALGLGSAKWAGFSPEQRVVILSFNPKGQSTLAFRIGFGHNPATQRDMGRMFELSPDAMPWISAGVVDLFALFLVGAVTYWFRR
jgi:hypothetical protein